MDDPTIPPRGSLPSDPLECRFGLRLANAPRLAIPTPTTTSLRIRRAARRCLGSIDGQRQDRPRRIRLGPLGQNLDILLRSCDGRWAASSGKAARTCCDRANRTSSRSLSFRSRRAPAWNPTRERPEHLPESLSRLGLRRMRQRAHGGLAHASDLGRKHLGSSRVDQALSACRARLPSRQRDQECDHFGRKNPPLLAGAPAKSSAAKTAVTLKPPGKRPTRKQIKKQHPPEQHRQVDR